MASCSVGRLVGQLVGRSVSWLFGWSFFKILRFGEYVAIVYTLINTLLIIVLYRHGIKCAITKVKHIVELKDRVLAPWGPCVVYFCSSRTCFWTRTSHCT